MFVCKCNMAKLEYVSKIFIRAIDLKWSKRIKQFSI